MFKKKMLICTMALMLAMIFLLSACGSTGGGDVFRVGVDDSYPPMEYKDTNGKDTIGFDVDVAKEIGKRLGKKEVKFISNDWTGIFDALETDKFDAIISSVSINPDRQENHSLTNAYIANKLVIVTPKSDTGIKSPEDLKGKKVGVQAGTTSEEFSKGLIEEGKLESGNLLTYPVVTQPFMDLSAGRIDAIVVDIVVAKYYVAKDKDKYNVAWESSEAEPMAICLKKKDTELRDKINKILDEMRADGTMKQISEKWFGEDVTQNLE